MQKLPENPSKTGNLSENCVEKFFETPQKNQTHQCLLNMVLISPFNLYMNPQLPKKEMN
jgi:hypothetical protein